MSTDKAFEVDGGIVVNDAAAILSGSGSPVGLSAPAGTLYLDSANVLWKKFSSGNNDWRILNGEDVDFDPTGLLNLQAGDTNVKLALERLGNQSVADLAEIEGFTSNAQETTTSNGWVSKSGFPWTTTGTKTAGEFSVRWFCEVGQTKATRNFGFRIRWRPTGGSYSILSEIDTMELPGDNTLVQQSGFKEVTLASDNTIEVDVQHGQTTAGFSSILSNVSVEVRRLGD